MCDVESYPLDISGISVHLQELAVHVSVTEMSGSNIAVAAINDGRGRNALREFYPAALEALGTDLPGRDPLALLRRAPTPEQGAQLSARQLPNALESQLGVVARAAELQQVLRTPCALTRSAGARDYYTTHRGRGHTHCQAPRALANRHVGILHACLDHRCLYSETVAWPSVGQIAA